MKPHDALRGLLADLHAQLPQRASAVLANAEGLILAADGDLASDAAAASAAHLAGEVDRCLALVSGGGFEEMLVWNEHALWCVVRLAGGWVLMVSAGGDCGAGALRLAAQGLGRALVEAAGLGVTGP